MERSLPNRRWLLRGAIASASGAAGAAVPLLARRGDKPTPAPGPAPARGPARRRDPVDFPSAAWVPAAPPNYTRARRPAEYPVEYVVIHLTTDTFNIMIDTFQDPREALSAHYVMRSYDGHIVQCVREQDVAWHSGNWDFNTRSIGIEHEGWMDQPMYTDAMYEASAELTASICAKYGIPVDRKHILGHVEVPLATHEDPGPNWDWRRYMKLVRAA
ncbi:hypothetical protein GCM10020367_67710 [Streptomyces sannanensis]|uniref:N-acetylmuramoyl-L-alanine amidase n=1 Tax=Streptomyces sannanensis TaxID=285536 RepID=A0ABP6S3N3_9ACTN